MAAPASIRCSPPVCVVACSAKTLFRMVPELDQPTPAMIPDGEPPRRSRRSQAAAVRTSSLAPLSYEGEGPRIHVADGG
jgi:hypothetical protein